MERTRDPVAGFVLVELADRVDARSGRLEAGPLRDAITAATASTPGRSPVALDLSAVHVMDAEVLGELAAAFSRLRRAGSDLVLVDPQKRVKRLLAVTRLDTVLPIWSRESEPEAVADLETEKSPAAGWFLTRVRQGCDLRIAESVSDAFSAATERFQFGARVSPVVR